MGFNVREQPGLLAANYRENRDLTFRQGAKVYVPFGKVGPSSYCGGDFAYLTQEAAEASMRHHGHPILRIEEHTINRTTLPMTVTCSLDEVGNQRFGWLSILYGSEGADLRIIEYIDDEQNQPVGVQVCYPERVGQ